MSPAADGRRAVVSVVGVCAVAIGMGAGFVNLVAYLIPVLREDLGISRTAAGAVVSAYFGATGIGSIAGGRIADRVGARWSVVAQLTTVAAGAGVTAAAGVYPVLLAAAVLVGFAYAMANAGTNIAVAAAVPVSRRGIGLTLKTAGGPTFASLAAFTAGAVGRSLGWRPMLAGLAVLAALGAVLAWRVLPDDRPERGSVDIRVGVLPPGFLWFPVAAFLFIAGAQSLFQWIVPYLEEGVGAAPGVAGAITSASIACGVVGMVFAALRSDRLGEGNRIVVLIAACIMCAVGEALAIVGGHLGVVWAAAGAVIGIVGLLGGTGVLHAAVVDAAPHAVGRASGVTFSGYYVGALVAPVAFGAVTDATGSYDAGWVLSMASVLLGALAFTRCAPKARPTTSEMLPTARPAH